MANKVITLNTNNVQSDKKLEVYRDLSMTSSRKNVRCFEKTGECIHSYDKTRLFVASDVNIYAIFNLATGFLLILVIIGTLFTIIFELPFRICFKNLLKNNLNIDGNSNSRQKSSSDIKDE